MRVAFLNTYCNGSTGRIIDSIKEACLNNQIEVLSIYARGVSNKHQTTSFQRYSRVGFILDALGTRLLDAHGLGNYYNTPRIIRKLEEFKPDVIHLHNLHGYWINYVLLFNYLKKKHDIKVVWTFHDCWHFTGHCTHFDYVKCNKWEQGCYKCIQTKEFPSSLFDYSKRNYRLKRNAFTSVKNMVIVTPSEWLKSKVKRSFLNRYEIKVINNGIDVDVFKPTPNKDLINSIKSRGYSSIVLGVAAYWNERKGLEYIQNVAMKRRDWYFVIIGAVKKDQLIQLENMQYIDRTENTDELCMWYSSADVLAQPTLEDTYPTTNLEAIACGTPVVTFPVGGSEEIVLKSGYGLVTKDKTEGALLEALEKSINNPYFSIKSDFVLDSRKTFEKYVDLYKTV